MPSYNFVIGPYTTATVGVTTYYLFGSQNVTYSIETAWHFGLNKLIQVGPATATIKLTILFTAGQSITSAFSNTSSQDVTLTHADGNTLVMTGGYVRATSIQDQKEGLLAANIEVVKQVLDASSNLFTFTA